MVTWQEVLEELSRCNGQITDFGHHAAPIFFDSAMGNKHSGERVEWEVFLRLREEGWIVTEDQGNIKRYRISAAGDAHLNGIQVFTAGPVN
jgi:hypothetical protein